MADQLVTAATPTKKRGWARLLVGCFGGLLVLILVAYFVATSGAFLKGFILPRVAKAMNAEITVGDASVSPFHQVVLKDLKVRTTGADPLVAVPEIRLRYSLLDILGGRINVEEVAVVSPTFILAVNPDGTSNLDPFTKAAPKGATTSPKPAVPAKPGKPLQLDIKKISLTGATVRFTTLYTNGNRDVYEVSNVNLTLNDLKNGGVGRMALAAAIRAQVAPTAARSATSLQASLNLHLDLGLAADAQLATAKGQVHLGVDQADGILAELASFSADLDGDLTPTDLKALALRFQKGKTSLGEIRASGPFDMAKLEGRIVIEIPAIDKQLLNLASAGSGMDFGTTVIKSTNTVTIAQSGSLITAGGQLSVNRLQVTLTNQTTPTLDFLAGYDVSVDRARTNTILRGFSLNAVQDGKSVLHAEMDSPITLVSGTAAGGLGDSALTAGITGLDLAQWKPLLGQIMPAGLVNAQMKLLSQQAGRQLGFDLNSTVEHLTVLVGTNTITEAGVSLQLNAKATDLKQFTVGQYKLQVTQRNQPLLTASGSAAFDKDAQDTDFKLTAQVMLARVLQALSLPVPPVVSEAHSEMGLAAEVALHKQVVDLRQFQLSLSPTARATNQIRLTGQVDLTSPTAIQGNLKLTADSLDFTTYYDLFAGGQTTSVAKTATASNQASSPSGQKGAVSGTPSAGEMAAIQFPIRTFTVDASIRRLYLHDLDIADFQTSTRIDSNQVVVAPLQLSLNGAPVNAGLGLDLSVPGFKYDFSLTATNVPIPPFISSFQPARQGQISGTLTCQAKMAGAGTVGASLQTNLAGQFYFGTTNLNLAVGNVQNKALKLLVEVVVQVPDLIKNPAAGASSLLSRLTGSTNNPTPNDLQHSIINSIVLKGGAGAGKISLQQASVSGPTFLAEAPTTVVLDPVLTNSALNVPVSVSLARDVAQKIRFLPPNTPTNAAYVKLPDFFTMKGTLGAPQKNINYLALASGTAQGIGGKAGSVIQNVTGLFGGGGTNSTAGSNAPAGKAESLLHGLGGLFGQPAASTNSPGAPTNAGPANLLDGLFGPKKK